MEVTAASPAAVVVVLWLFISVLRARRLEIFLEYFCGCDDRSIDFLRYLITDC